MQQYPIILIIHMYPWLYLHAWLDILLETHLLGIPSISTANSIFAIMLEFSHIEELSSYTTLSDIFLRIPSVSCKGFVKLQNKSTLHVARLYLE